MKNQSSSEKIPSEIKVVKLSLGYIWLKIKDKFRGK